MELKPLRGRILVMPDEIPTQTPSGLEIVRNWNPETTGSVVAVGPGEICACGRRQDSPVFIDDHIVFRYEAGQEVTLEGERYIVLLFADIIGILEEGSDGRHRDADAA